MSKNDASKNQRRTSISAERPTPRELTPEFQKEYQEIFVSGKVARFKEFVRSNFPHLKDKDDFTLETLFHRGTVNRPGVPKELVERSTVWLLERGLSPIISRRTQRATESPMNRKKRK